MVRFVSGEPGSRKSVAPFLVQYRGVELVSAKRLGEAAAFSGTAVDGDAEVKMDMNTGFFK